MPMTHSNIARTGPRLSKESKERHEDAVRVASTAGARDMSLGPDTMHERDYVSIHQRAPRSGSVHGKLEVSAGIVFAAWRFYDIHEEMHGREKQAGLEIALLDMISVIRWRVLHVH